MANPANAENTTPPTAIRIISVVLNSLVSSDFGVAGVGERVVVVIVVGYVQVKLDAALEMRILVSSQVGYGDLMASVKTDEFPKS